MAYGLTKSLRLTKASSQYATTPDTAANSITGDITIEFWIKMKETLSSGQYRNFIIKSSLGASDRGYELIYGNVAGTPKLLFYIFAGGTPTNFFEGSLSYTLTADTWYHVALTCDVSAAAASKMQWYINGVSQGAGTGANTGSGTTAIFNSTKPLRIGQADPITAGYYVDAQFSLLRIWDIIRTQSEIEDNMCNVLGATTNLQGEWTLDDVYTDNSGNSQTFSGVNTPTFVTDTPSTCAAAGTTINPVAQVLTFSLPAETVTGEALVSVSTQVANFSLPTRTVTADWKVNVNTQVATFSLPAYTVVAGGIAVIPEPQVLTFSLPAETVLGNAIVSPDAQSLTFTLPANTVTADWLVGVSPVVLTVTIPTIEFVGALWGRTARSTTGADWTRSIKNNS